MRASRRVVTVVFADLVGFTSLSERLDAEDVAAVQQAYFSRARESLLRHGGVVEKYIGDAVVGSFGVARARDDDAEQAIRAALDITASVARLGVMFGLGATELQVRVGVHTGEVLISRNGASWQLTGDVVNVTARLQSRAEPGTVLVGPDTALAVESTMLLEPRGPVALKGRTAQVEVWEVRGPRATPLHPATLLGRSPATLGRERELASLLESWRSTSSEPTSWLVTAPPGAGKSRLANELAGRVEAEGGAVWVTSASPGDGTGYRCIASLVQQCLGRGLPMSEVVPEVSARLLRRGASELQAHVGAEHVHALLRGGELFVDPADLFSSWTAVLESHDSPVPPVWVVEDLHQAGPDLVEFLRFAASEPGRSPRMLVMTSRPSRTVETLSRDPSLRSLHLDPLPDEISIRMVEAIVGPATLPDSLVRTVAGRARGNPLFIEELFRSWLQSGVLEVTEEGSWVFRDSPRADLLPTTIQSVYLGQLDGLPEAPRQVIHSGSIPGYTFPSAALPMLEVADAEAGLRLLTELGLLLGPHEGDADPLSYTYRHGLLREVAYATLSRSDRARMHLRFARWVESRRSGVAAEEAVGRHLAAAYDNLPRLAEQLEPGQTRESLAVEAATRLEHAADLHLTSAPARAALLLSQVIGLGPSAEPGVDVRRRLKLGDAQRRSAHLEEAMRTFADVGDLVPPASEETDHLAALVSAALGYEDALFASRLPREQWGAAGTRLLEGALRAGPTDDQRAMLLAAHGRALLFVDETSQQGRSHCAEAVRLAERSGSDTALAYALLASRSGQMSPDSLAERRRTVELAGRAAGRSGDLEAQLEAARLQVVDALEDGDVGSSDEARGRSEDLIARLRRPLYFWYPPMWRAMRALLDGDPDRAEPLVEAFLEEGTRWHYRDVDQVHAVQSLELHSQRGEAERALPVLRQLVLERGPLWSTTVAVALARSGHRDEAQEQLDLALDHGFEHPRNQAWTHFMALRAECAATLGDTRAAGEVSRLLGPWAGRAVVLGSGALCLGSASHYLGLTARVRGEEELAAGLFTESVALNRRMGARRAARCSQEQLELALSPSVTDPAGADA